MTKIQISRKTPFPKAISGRIINTMMGTFSQVDHYIMNPKKMFIYSAMIFLLLHIAIMAPPYVQGGGIGPNVYDKLNVASMGKVKKTF